MRLVTWNVNGLRAALRKGFLDFVEAWTPDVLCLQETRATPEQVSVELPGYEAYWNPAERKGYAGTAIFTRVAPEGVRYGLGQAEHDGEGRVITFTLADFHLVNVYTPNAQRTLDRLEYRTQRWDVDFLAYLKRLEETRPVVFCGDLNVAHTEIDLANPKNNVRNAGFTPQERAGFDNILAAGFVDAFRVFTSEGGHYTWWSQLRGVRERNIGWRIDYFCVSEALRSRLQRTEILSQVHGSDHCPVLLELA